MIAECSWAGHQKKGNGLKDATERQEVENNMNCFLMDSLQEALAHNWRILLCSVQFFGIFRIRATACEHVLFFSLHLMVVLDDGVTVGLLVVSSSFPIALLLDGRRRVNHMCTYAA